MSDKYVKIPIWLAVILTGAILTVAGDTWLTVQAVEKNLLVLKTALTVKGIIDPKVCQAVRKPAEMLHLDGAFCYQTYQNDL